MENYTKYRLKGNEELTALLEGKDKLFVIACNKCFKEFVSVDEPDCDEFVKFAAELGKTVTGTAKVDFLCNKTQTEKKLKDRYTRFRFPRHSPRGNPALCPDPAA